MSIQKTHTSNFFQSFLEKIEEQSKALYLIISLCSVIALSFVIYTAWATKKEKSIQYDFGILIGEYENMLQDKNPDWNSLLEKFESTYNKHSSSTLINYYLGYKVQILLQQNKTPQALAVLDTIISNAYNSPFLPLYETERALIQLDTTDTDLQNRGLEALKTIANDKNNMYRDTAQFYLGRYYWATDRIDDAREIWQQLMDEQHDEKFAPSPWIQFVQEKLNLLDNE